MKSNLFDDNQLAHGLAKRMAGYHFCFTGDRELIRLGFMLQNNPNIKPHVTAKGKLFLMEVLGKIAEPTKEDQPTTAPKAKSKDLKEAREILNKLTNKKTSSIIVDEDDDDEDDEIEVTKKEKKEKDKK